MMRTDQLGVEWSDNEAFISTGFDLDVVRTASTKQWDDADPNPPAGTRGPLPDVNVSPPDSTPSGRAESHFSFFGSSHPAGANFALCDGSVRMIRYNPDPVTFRRLCEIADGQPVTLDP